MEANGLADCLVDLTKVPRAPKRNSIQCEERLMSLMKALDGQTDERRPMALDVLHAALNVLFMIARDSGATCDGMVVMLRHMDTHLRAPWPEA